MAPSLYSEKIIMIKNYQLGLYEKVTPQDLSWEERLEVAAKNGSTTWRSPSTSPTPARRDSTGRRQSARP